VTGAQLGDGSKGCVACPPRTRVFAVSVGFRPANLYACQVRVCMCLWRVCRLRGGVLDDASRATVCLCSRVRTPTPR
jgi:hypothetical protein